MFLYDMKSEQNTCIYISIRQSFFEYTFRTNYLDDNLYSDNVFMHFDQLRYPDALIEEIRDCIAKKNGKTIVLWDARDVSYTKHHLYKKFIFPLIEERKIAFCLFAKSEELNLAKEQNKGRVIESSLSYNSECSESTALLLCPSTYSEDDEALTRTQISNVVSNYGGLDDILGRMIFFGVKENDTKISNRGKNVKILSSNIYSNSYFNCKKIYHSRDLFQMVVYSLASLIHEKFPDREAYDDLLCASLNGYAFASALSTILKKPVTFLDNLGPLDLFSAKSASKLKESKKYLYIFDFMCMGSEHERVNLLCKAMKAKLFSSVGISHFRFPSVYQETRNTSSNIYTLFGINDYQKEYYKCYINEFDGINGKGDN